jgi:multidrug efflux pump subunit AcrA (membrane-fusion protein)
MGALSILPLAWSFATTRLGLAALAGVVCFAFGYHRASEACEARQAAAQAAQLRAELIERARQAKAAATIDAQDRLRAQALAGANAAMQAEIDRLKDNLSDRARNEAAHAQGNNADSKADPHRPGAPGCAIDGDFARRVRRLDAAGR